MRLDVVSGAASVTAIDLLDPLLEHGSLAVRLDAVSTILDAIRVAAVAVTPADDALLEANPSRMSMLAQTIMAVSAAGKALADAVEQIKTVDSADPAAAGAAVEQVKQLDGAAQTILGALSQLHL